MNNALAVKLLESFVSAYERDSINELSLLVGITKTSLAEGVPVDNTKTAYAEVTSAGLVLHNVRHLRVRDNLAAEAISLVNQGLRFDAIKLVRANAVISLKDAKDVVDSIKL